MPPWTPLAPGSHAIVHLSDLHFGLRGATDVFSSVRSFVETDIGDALAAVLITGDIIDTPEDSAALDQAHTALTTAWNKTPVYVIGGNHDLYKKGNILRFFWDRPRLVRSFRDKFGDQVVGPNRRVIEVGPWRIGVVGVETAEHADFFARGYLKSTQLDQIVAASRQAGFDLWILMAHHHLLPVKGLEERNHHRIKDLASVTHLVNGASASDRLAGSGIDLVLHGHEHSQNLLRYDNLGPAQREVVILGAGSGTGVTERRVCEASHSSFNVLILGADGSVRNRVTAHAGATWEVKDDREILAPEVLRRSRIYRDEAAAANRNNNNSGGSGTRRPAFRGRVDGEICKSVVFSSNRDITIDLELKGWRIDKDQDRCSFRVGNGTGIPVAPKVTLAFDGVSSEPVQAKATIVPNPEVQGEWFIEWDMPQTHRDRPLDLRIAYIWRAGALLTSQELRAAGDRAREFRRGRGQEFSTLKALDLVAIGRLFVMVSRRYAPQQPEVLVFDERDCERPDAAHEAARCLTRLGEGRFLLTIKYPRVGWRYVVAWQLPEWRPAERAAKRIAALTAGAGAFLERLKAELPKDTAWGSDSSSEKEKREPFQVIQWSISLYLRNETGLSMVAGDARLERSVALEGDRSFLARACWGVPIRVDRGNSDSDERRARIAGLMAGEESAWAIPLVLDLSQDNEIIGVARIAIPPLGAAIPKRVELMLARAVVSGLIHVEDEL